MATLPKVLAPVVHQLGPTLTTTDATLSVLARYVIPGPGAFFVNAKVVAVGTTDYAEAGTYWRQALAYMRDVGDIWMSTVRTVVTDNESTATWNVNLDVSSQDVDGDGDNEPTIRVLVTGKAATTIKWRGVVEIIEVT